MPARFFGFRAGAFCFLLVDGFRLMEIGRGYGPGAGGIQME